MKKEYHAKEGFKHSGIAWLGEIPMHWEVRKVKNLFEIGRGRVISQEELESDGLISCLFITN